MSEVFIRFLFCALQIFSSQLVVSLIYFLTTLNSLNHFDFFRPEAKILYMEAVLTESPLLTTTRLLGALELKQN